MTVNANQASFNKLTLIHLEFALTVEENCKIALYADSKM
jgi:hypothetical protein